MRDVGDKRLNSVVNFATVGTAAAAARLAVNPYSVAKIWVETGVPGGKSGSFQAMNWI
uniref:Uncharacterized protein n=1 Tax=Plectus sambesii TaxID=2011161 RepID=A0A914XIY6_9BILA